MGQNKNLLISITFATLCHLLILLFFPKFNSTQKTSITPAPILNIKSIDNELLNKYRTVGVKKGSKNFSTPSAPAKLESSSLKPHKIVEVKKVSKEKPISGKLFENKYLKMTPGEVLSQKIEKKNILKRLPLPAAVAKSLGRSNLNIKFDPPEGVAEDELNSSEKKFFSFTKRSYETYVLSVIKSLNELLKERPHLKNFQSIGEHHLTGRIIFDGSGHTRSVKFIQSSKDDNIQLLFERALTRIRVLQNPPRELLDKDSTFTIYYQLSIEN